MEGWCIARMREELFHHTMPARVWGIAVRDMARVGTYTSSSLGHDACRGSLNCHTINQCLYRNMFSIVLFAQILFNRYDTEKKHTMIYIFHRRVKCATVRGAAAATAVGGVG